MAINPSKTVFTKATSKSVFRAVPRIAPKDGEDGRAGTIEVGTVTTLAPGEPATVINVGTETDAKLDFGIPEGPPGNDGIMTSVVPGANISVDATDPANPVISADGIISPDNSVTAMVALTQAAYDLLAPPDPTTFYVILDA